ncbi:ABC transporter substrate-binding protein [Gordonia metallireducens]|uniref:ABC transporter substrate-binding protein n=1 Tax=Gordonia metallireducens TaxID=2897779 RepID=UPI001E5B93DC|nr:ABC transporter substrate-binding protein [Gordonia metallireducens]
MSFLSTPRTGASRRPWSSTLRFAGAAVAAVAAISLTACGSDNSAGNDGKVEVVLGWVVQPEFASVFAAEALGYYDEAGLDVTIKPGGPEVNAEQLVGAGSAQFGVDNGSNVFLSNDVGTDLVTLAQLEQETSLRLVSRAADNLQGPETWKGKKIGVWSSANSLYASLAKHNVEKDTDVTLVEQGFDMSQFLNGEIDMASAYGYNEVGQILQAGVPLSDLTIYDYSEDGTATIGLQLFGNGDFVESNPEKAADFTAATIKGQVYCRDNPEECVQFVADAGATIDKNFMLWQMNEVNKSVWSTDVPVGTLDRALYQQTADVLADTGVIENAPDLDAVMGTEIYNSAVEKLTDLDLTNKTFTPKENPIP